MPMKPAVGVATALMALAMLMGGCTGSGDPPVEGVTRTIPTDATGPLPVVAVQDDRFVNADADLDERLRYITGTGARATRVDVFWKDVAPERPARPADPADPAYRWTRLDAILSRLAAADIQIILDVFNPPAWATGGRTTANPGESAYNNIPPSPLAYGEFMEALSRRYSGGSTTDDGEPLPDIRFYEVWNEPNLDLFYRPGGGTKGRLDAYAGLVRAAYPAVKRGGGSDTVVLVGAGGPRSRTGRTGVGARDWVRGLRKRDVPLDVYSQHIYPAANPTDETPAFPAWATLPELLDEITAWRPALKLAITEAGYTTAATEYRKTRVTEEQQATNLRDMFDLPAVRDPRVLTVVWFNLQDNAAWPAGLLREDGSEKPSWDVFRRITAEPQRTLTR
ncbi:MAG: hypothetical protein H6531_09620 [Actinobacteria bacterium]|nr:hypothetical protein [Actinomycetota bacterium]